MTFMENLIAGFFEFSIAIVTFFPEEREELGLNFVCIQFQDFPKSLDRKYSSNSCKNLYIQFLEIIMLLTCR